MASKKAGQTLGKAGQKPDKGRVKADLAGLADDATIKGKMIALMAEAKAQLISEV